MAERLNASRFRGLSVGTRPEPRTTDTSLAEYLKKCEYLENKKRSSLHYLNVDFVAVSLILILIIVRFFKTIFFGDSLSNVYLTAHWDSIFYALRSGANFPMDSSLVLQFAPQLCFVAKFWHHGLPLWNHFSGLGMPLLADPQTFVLSPLCLLFFLVPNMYVWGFSIVLKLALGAVATYFLAKQLNMAALAALVAALLFTFCPWVQFESEMLGNGICLAPLVILCFVRAAKHKSLWYAAFAGIALAVDLLSSHPEIAFVTTVFGCISMICVELEYNQLTFNWRSTISKIATAGLVSFGLAAPMLLPFCELLMNGETYKFSTLGMSDISLSALCALYIYPFYRFGSAFVGPLSWIAIPSILLARLGQADVLFKTPLLCLFMSALAVAKAFPLDGLFLIPPFREVNSIYCLPVYILFLSIVSGLGAQALFKLSVADRLPKTSFLTIFKPIAIVIGLACLALAPAIYSLWQKQTYTIDFGFLQEMPRLSWRWWLIDAAPILSLFLMRNGASNHALLRMLAPLLVTSTSVLGLISISTDSLPLRPNFSYPDRLPVAIEDQHAARAISVGVHVFRPATNLVYDIAMLTPWNPLFPKGFGDFIESCKAMHTEANTYTFNAGIGKLIDLAGVKTIFATQPLLDSSQADLASASAKRKYAANNILFSKDLVLSNVQIFEDRQAHTIFCRSLAYPLKSDSLALYFELKNSQGKVISSIEGQPIWNGIVGQTVVCSGSLPQSEAPYEYVLRVAKPDGGNLPATFASEGHLRPDGIVSIGYSNEPSLPIEVKNNRFKEVSRSGTVAVYENKGAFDKAFLVKHITWSNSKTDAIDWLKHHEVEIADTVALDNRQEKAFTARFKEISGGLPYTPSESFDSTGTATILTPPNQLSTDAALDISVQTRTPGLVAVSELYYPGWQATIDGDPTPIFRADSIMRAVLVPAGKHLLRFEYRPISVILGFAVFILTALSLTIAWGIKSKKQRPQVD